ncbi:hypothetical protein J6590_017814 [Homalodisca vitripennis]|nr:hypothetical protein J6590_017814 [Homalodisca vitripennis]
MILAGSVAWTGAGGRRTLLPRNSPMKRRRHRRSARSLTEAARRVIALVIEAYYTVGLPCAFLVPTASPFWNDVVGRGRRQDINTDALAVSSPPPATTPPHPLATALAAIVKSSVYPSVLQSLSLLSALNFALSPPPPPPPLYLRNPLLLYFKPRFNEQQSVKQYLKKKLEFIEHWNIYVVNLMRWLSHNARGSRPVQPRSLHGAPPFRGRH